MPTSLQNGADLRVGSAVGTDTLVDYLVTQDLLHEIVKNGVNIRCAVGIPRQNAQWSQP